MLAKEIKHHLKSQKDQTLKQLYTRFSIEPEHMRDILSKWVERGLVEKRLFFTACSVSKTCACDTCIAYELEVYKWVGES